MIVMIIIRCHLASFWVDISVTMVVVTAIAVTTAAAGTLEPAENSNGN